MRFGPFVFQISAEPALDSQILDNTLKEAELADALGYDVVWLSEHYFSGDTVYADPVVFGAAIAVRTKQIKIGFAIVQMAFHHPVKLAAQTALLDNLSHGRLIVGTGRGTSFNAFEYDGFGVTMEEAKERLAESEDLLLRAWTEKDLDYKGQHWQVKLPIMRPIPYQKPHPPLMRACISDESIMDMARLGRPVMLRVETIESLNRRLKLYRDTMEQAGFEEAQIEKVLEETWVQNMVYVAENHEQAQEEGRAAFQADFKHSRTERSKFNPPGFPERAIPASSQSTLMAEHYTMVGSPKYITERVAELRDVGARNIMMRMSPSNSPREKIAKSIQLFAEQVIPKFRKN